MTFTRSLLLGIGFLSFSAMVSAQSADSWIKANMILAQLDQLKDKYEDVQALLSAGTITLEVAEPLANAEGKYVLPFKQDGSVTPWAEKAITAAAAGEAGAMAGEKAAESLAAKVPFGGLAVGLMKGKAKELAAVTALGGWEFIRGNSDASFNSQDEYSVYLHTKFAGGTDYQTALAAAMAIYPELEKKHESAIDAAYKKARKAAK